MKRKVTIIGAGVAGLSAGIYLQRKGFEVQILEASDRAGGRIKTDFIDGFRLDHGFQVLLEVLITNGRKINISNYFIS